MMHGQKTIKSLILSMYKPLGCFNSTLGEDKFVMF
jgi:hypothetical protein